MTDQELEAIILRNITGIAALDYSDVSYMDEFIETAHSPHLLVSGVECHIERTRHIDARWLPVNYVVVSQLDGNNAEYRPTITVGVDTAAVAWEPSKQSLAIRGYVNAVKAETVITLTGGTRV